MTQTPGLDVRALSASHGSSLVLDSIDLRLSKGETLSLLGPSGCGKTTLLRSIAGLHPNRQGEIDIDGQAVDGPEGQVPAQHRKVGMVFQDGALFPHLTVRANVLFGLTAHENAQKRADEVLELVDMQGFDKRLPGTLSGGQQQRVALARALAPQPTILLLDEPFSALDAGLRVQLRREVKQILTEVGITSVVVTHDQEEAFVLGDRVAVMHSGLIVQLDSPDGLYRRPVSPWVAQFVGEANFVDGACSARMATTSVGEVPLSKPTSGDAQVLIRPEQLRLTPARTTGPQTGTITSVEYFGHDIRYEVVLQDGSSLGVRTTSANLAVGDLADVSFCGDSTISW